MKLRQFLLLSAAAFALLSTFITPTTFAAQIVVPADFVTIQGAINAAVSGDEVLVEPGTYTEKNITLKNGVTLRGRETARTVLDGGGAGTMIVADTITVVTVVRNITIINATVGIAVSNSSALEIRNNVFRVGAGGTAITTASSATTKIVNNVFHSTGVAISTTDTTLNIINNIFSAYASAASTFPVTILTDNILDNLFTGTAGTNVDTITRGNITGQDPLFVDPDGLDFHLRSNTPPTPCKDEGNSSAGNDSIDNTATDIGAYGGSQSDTIPLPVSGVTATASGTTVSVAWTPNLTYTVIGYKVYHRAATASTYVTPADDSTTSSKDVTGLTPVGTAPAVPTLASPMDFANQTLKPVWNFVSGATGYKLHYGITTTAENTIDVGNVNTYAIMGLTNGVTYKVAVSSYAQATYYFAVTAYNSATSTPGVSQESDYSSEVPAVVGTALESLPSGIVEQYPEAINAYPNLPDKGCFIATAAYGHYSAPQVRALRKFRDEYLLRNEAGKAFVRWYYEQGPRAARLLNEHPWLKPAVRAALLPAVAGAMLLTGTPGAAKTVAALCLTISIGYLLFYRRKLRQTGGRR